MATLVAPLAAGIAGAASGTAEFYGRGSTTPIQAYSRTGAALGKILTLDGNGGYEAYVAEAAFIRVRSSVGIVVREFDVVAGDKSIDVESASFTGLLASGSQGAGGLVDLRTVLNRWVTSAGTLDFKVLRPGAAAAETLSTAFGNVLVSNQPFFNVKTYGAAGDGTTDDGTAIDAAVSAAVAAGGGIVFFPGGTYLRASAMSITSQKVTLKGAGAAASILKSSLTSGTILTVNAGAGTFSGCGIEGLQIIPSSAGTNVTPLTVLNTPGFFMRDVLIKDCCQTVDIRSRSVLLACDFTVPTSATVGDYVLKFSSTADGSVVLGGTFTQLRTANTGGIYLSATQCVVLGAKIDITGSAAGFGVDVDQANCKLVACNIVTGTSGSRGYRVNADVAFDESLNTFGGSGSNLSALTTGASTRVFRGSRIARFSTQTVNTGGGGITVNPAADAEFNEIIVNAGTGALTLGQVSSVSNAPGTRLITKVSNTTGGGIAIAFSGAAGGYVGGVGGTIAAGKTRIYQWVWLGTAAAGFWYRIGADSTDY